MDRLYVGNEQLVTLQSLVDEGGAAVTDANPALTLYEVDGITEVRGTGWPHVLRHNGSGTYTGYLPASLALRRGGTYWARVVAKVRGAMFTEWRQAYAVRWMK